MNPDDNLKDILGYDPTTGDRVEDRQGLKPLPQKGEQPQHISKEVQDEFRTFASSYTKGLMGDFEGERIIPESLLLRVPNDYGDCTSFYFGLKGGKDMFRKTVKAGFHYIDGKYEPSKLEYFGESPQERITLNLSTAHEPDRKWFGISFSINLQNRSLSGMYDISGRLIQLDFSPSLEQPLQEDWNLTQADVDNLLKNKSQVIKGEGGQYQLSVDEAGKLIKITRKKGKAVLDSVEVPIAVQKSEIIEDLFPKDLLADPFRASPDQDRWRYADAPSVVGIKWERH